MNLKRQVIALLLPENREVVCVVAPAVVLYSSNSTLQSQNQLPCSYGEAACQQAY